MAVQGSTAAAHNIVRALAPRFFLTVCHLVAVVLAGWLLFGGGLANATAVPLRRELLFACAVVYFLRVLFTSFYLMQRRMGWGEAALIAVWAGGIHLLFAYLGATNARPVGARVVAGTVLYIAGSFANTGSELQRKKWKQRPENAGRLFTGGLFRHAMHINYFGDELLFTGYALITGSAWAVLVPVVMLAGFVWVSIPRLDQHLRERYGSEFQGYAERTRRFVPFVY